MTSWRWTARTSARSHWKSAGRGLAKLLSRKTKAMRDGIQVSEAITGDGGRHLSSCVLDGPRRHRLEAHRLALRQRTDQGMAEDEEPGFRAIPNALF